MKSKGLSCLLAALIMLTFIPQTAIPGTTVSYDVYLLSDSFTDPQDGLRVASEEETYEFGGFHKKSLSTPVPLQKGQKYSIVITQTVPDGRYAYSMQYGTGESLAMFLEQNSWQKGIKNRIFQDQP